MSDPFLAGRLQFYRTVQQNIECEEYYPRESLAQEDYMLQGIDDLYDRGVITDSEAVAIFGNWIVGQRPNTTVVSVANPLPRGAFYE